MKGFVVAEQAHVCVPIYPKDVTGGKKGIVFNMENYAHASIIVAVGVSAAAFTKLLVNECSDSIGTGRTAIAFNYYKQDSTVSGDVLSAKTAAAAAGVTPSAVDDIMYVIELDAAELSDGKGWVEVEITNAGNSVIASAVAILSGSRYAGAASPTVQS